MCIFVQRATQNGQPIIVFNQTKQQTNKQKQHLTQVGRTGRAVKNPFFINYGVII